MVQITTHGIDYPRHLLSHSERLSYFSYIHHTSLTLSLNAVSRGLIRNWKPRDDSELLDEVLHLKSIGHAIEETVDKGKLDLTFMIRTQDYTQSIRRHEAVGPQYILAMVLGNLQRGVNCNDLLGVIKSILRDW